MKKSIVGFSLAAAFLTGFLLAQEKPDFKVVVNSSNSVSSLSEAEVSQYLLKKVTRWPGGSKVLPVDQLEKSDVRAAFTAAIHKKDVASIKSYWNSLIFSGRGNPPPELPNDESVLSYVRSNADAIGYVSKSATVSAGVQVLEVTR